MKKIITLLFITTLLASCGMNNEKQEKMENEVKNNETMVVETQDTKQIAEPLSEDEINAAIDDLFKDVK